MKVSVSSDSPKPTGIVIVAQGTTVRAELPLSAASDGTSVAVGQLSAINPADVLTMTYSGDGFVAPAQIVVPTDRRRAAR